MESVTRLYGLRSNTRMRWQMLLCVEYHYDFGVKRVEVARGVRSRI